jgi:ParB/RepB/Spo0J family partition protein
MSRQTLTVVRSASPLRTTDPGHSSAYGRDLYAALPVDVLTVHPRNPRRELGPDDDLADLADSIRSRGVLEPLVVTLDDTGGYHVLMGQRRLAAARIAGTDRVPCIIRGDVDEVDALIDMLGENLHRAALSPIEEAQGYRQLTLDGLDAEEIADRLGRSRGTVRARLGLLDLPEETRAKVHHGQITLDQAAALGSFAEYPDLYAELTDAVGTASWRFTLERARMRRTDRDAAAVARAIHEAAGVRVVERADVPHRAVDEFRLVTALGGHHWDVATDEQVAEHASCPGHAVLAPTRDEEPVWLCLTPEVHGRPVAIGGAVDAGEEGLSTDEIAARRVDRSARMAREAAQLDLDRVARQAHEVDVRAAAGARLAWIREWVTSPRRVTVRPATAIARAVAQACAYEIEHDVGEWALLLGIDITDLHGDDLSAAVTETTWGRDPHRMLLAMLATHYEPGARLPTTWAQDPPRVQPWIMTWLDLLLDLGWEPSPWEAERIDATRAELGDQDAAESDRPARTAPGAP